MSQNDFNIANQGFASFRGDLNSALQALASLSSGATAPTTTYANQLWYETDTNILHIRNEANSAWLDVMVIDGTTGSPSFTSGNVGIGTAVPAQMLHLSGTVPDIQYTDTTGNEWRVGNNNGVFRFYNVTAAAERLRIDASGNVGINTSSPATMLVLSSDNTGGTAQNILRFNDADVTAAENQETGKIEFYVNDASTGGSGVGSFITGTAAGIAGGGHLLFGTSASGATGGTESMRITSTGLVGIGTDTPTTALDVRGDISTTGGFIDTGTNSTVTQAMLTAYRAGDGVQTGNYVRIRSVGNGSGDATQMIFDTNSSEAMRIDANGSLLVASTDTTPANSNVVGLVLRFDGTVQANGNATNHRFGRTNDGTVLGFYSAGNIEGTISISGTTTSYNGGHLARWAQFADNSRPDLLKGTVMSNLDQMSSWDNEDNEQLNCIKVSDTEGDANVAGVFVAWDSEDDGYNDILLAMTGDMVIRIGAGTTVQRGDLLMSAGDGTAMPQGDDLVRSKTIAKVTSTHVSHTYDDGSYCVPCVLMAC